MDLTLDTALLLAALIIFASGLVTGLTGFGFAMVSAPPLLMLYDPPMVVSIIVYVSLLTAVLIVGRQPQLVERKLVGQMLPVAAVGQVLGVIALTQVDANILKALVGTIVLVWAVLLLRGLRLHGGTSPLAVASASLASGALTTSTGLSGPPVILLFTAREMERDHFRVTISAYFLGMGIIAMVVLAVGGAVGGRELATSLALIPSALLGTLVGSRVSRYLTPTSFRRLTLALLLLSGVSGAVTALLQLR